MTDGSAYAGTSTVGTARKKLPSLSSNIYSILERQYDIELMKSTINLASKNLR